MSTYTITNPALDALQRRVLASASDRDAWLAARRSVVTATEAKVFLSGSTGEKHQIIREKVSGEVSFKGNQYTENGLRREPHILEWLARYGWAECGLLIHSADNARHAATPDAIRVNFDDEVELAEIKTSKNNVAPGSEAFVRAGYLLQMQWQMWCTGARRVLYVWEQHNDDWSRWPEHGPKPSGDPRMEWVERDDELIGKMVAAADRWLVKLDEALADAPVIDPVLDVLALDVLAGRRAEVAGKAQRESAWKELLGKLDGRGELSQRSGSAQVTWTPPVVEVVSRDVVDEAGAREAHPEVWEAWSAALAKFTSTVEDQVTTKGKLTVTSVKSQAVAA